MNRLFYRLFFIAILFAFIISCNTSVPTDPPPVIEPPAPEKFSINFDFSIESSSTNNYDAETPPPPPVEGEGGGGGDVVIPEPPISPVVIRFGEKLYPIEELYEGLEFTNNSELELTVSVNKGYNIFVGGSLGGETAPEIKPEKITLTFQLTNNMGIIIHVTNTAIDFRKITVKKFGRCDLLISGTRITDTNTHKLSFPKGYSAKMRFDFPEENSIIYSYSMNGGTTIHYPPTDSIVTNILMDNDVSYLFRFGRRNDPWDGTSKEEAIFENDIYEIYNSYELAWVASQANIGSNNFSGKIVALSNNMDLNSLPFDGIGRKRFFAGMFEGNNKIVNNLRVIPMVGSSANGFIGQLNGGSVSNLTIRGSVEGTNESVGGIVAIAGDRSHVFNVTNYARVSGTKTTSATGGIIGNMLTDSKVGYLANYGIVRGSRNVGGVVGRTISSVNYSYNETNVFGDTCVGGIVGSNGGGGVKYSYNTGDIEGSKNYVGGIVGYTDNVSVSVAYNTGLVKGNDYVGGMEGYRNTDVSLASTYNLANVTGNGQHVAALTGYSAKESDGVVNMTLERSYALQTTTINNGLLLYFGHGGGNYKDDPESRFITESEFETIGFLDANFWVLETFTGNRVINGVSKRYVIKTLEEKE